MHTLLRTALFVASLIALAACAPTAPTAADTAADEAAMRTGTETWIAAYAAGDVDQIVALYAEDAVVMPPDAPPASGHDAMREYLAADIAATQAAGMTLVLGDGATGVSGDLGWHSGTFTVTDSSGSAAGTGKFVEVWRKADGKWLMVRDIWNNDAPPAPPAAAVAPAAPVS